MIKSMTGYGRGEFSNEFYNFKVEIKSVNHRYNDITIKMPRYLSVFEESIKKIVKEKISRGKVDIYVNLEYIHDSAIDIKADIPLALTYKNTLMELSKELDLQEDIRLHTILGMPEVIKTERKELDEDLAFESLKEALSIALYDIINMRIEEGKALKKDMISNLTNIEDLVKYIEDRAPLVVTDYRDRLRERINEILDKDIEIDEDRLNYEVVHFADRSNINEEIVRLRSHIKQFYSILDEEGSVGRKLDFLTQELNRETNTIGSKANDIQISQYVVEIKSEIEKIREQVQNIE